jgi:cell division protein ZapA
MKSRVVHVEIHGQKYAVRSDLDPAYIAELASYVHDKMRLASDDLANAEPLRVAVIAALNIADELSRARATESGLGGRVEARAGEIERLIDAALDGARRQAVAANG